MIKLEELNFIIFYTAFILFVAYFSGALSIGILQNAEIIPADFTPTYDPFQVFGMFILLFVTGVAPEFTIVFTLILAPYFFGLAYIVWKALPFT